jgi:divalent metal cation (Fe/Co/Zn/Cd) transporter
MARKWNSQALEADALHFSTDIWSSSVVIAGLGLVFVARQLHIPWLESADAVAAMGVAGIVVFVSLQLGKRTIQGLLDEVPPDLVEEICRVAKVPGVLEVGRVRVRRSGPEAFADVTLAVNRDLSLEQSHNVASTAESAVRELLPGADVVVHIEPMRAKDEEVPSTVRLLAARYGLGVHNIRFFEVQGSRSLEMHLEVDKKLRLEQAHQQATAFEKALHDAVPQVERIVTHIEPAGGPIPADDVAPDEEARVKAALDVLQREMAVEFHPHDVSVSRDDGQIAVSFHCRLDPNAPIADAHAITEEVEAGLRLRLPDLGRVMIHMEPAGERET